MLLVLQYGLLAFILATCLFALWKGGTPERLGSAVIIANLAAGYVFDALGSSEPVTLAIDGLTALVLLALALRYASVWLGGVMLLYGVQFALHAYYFVLELRPDFIHAIINNIIFFLVSLSLAAGTVGAWRQRRAPSAQPAP